MIVILISVLMDELLLVQLIMDIFAQVGLPQIQTLVYCVLQGLLQIQEKIHVLLRVGMV